MSALAASVKLPSLKVKTNFPSPGFPGAERCDTLGPFGLDVGPEKPAHVHGERRAKVRRTTLWRFDFILQERRFPVQVRVTRTQGVVPGTRSTRETYLPIHCSTVVPSWCACVIKLEFEKPARTSMTRVSSDRIKRGVMRVIDLSVVSSTRRLPGRRLDDCEEI